MNSARTHVGPGFRDPVSDPQKIFRSVLDATASPGTVVSTGAAVPERGGLPPAAAAFLLALADQETPIRLPGRLRGGEAARWLAFHTGASLTEEDDTAIFAVIDADESVTPADFNPGEDRYPDRSATVLVLCPSLEGGDSVRLTGPGIEKSARIAPAGLRPGFWSEAAANAARFPLGVDLIFVAGDRLVAVPRSTALSVEEVR
jgi:alpha-D-ribose 1-methylphosphonate 5-triphosphate synthase subunit PhnH